MMARQAGGMDGLQAAFGARLLAAEPLARYTSARIGGPADHFVAVQSVAELEQAVRLAWAAALPFRVLGSGSNILVADAGYRGLVIHNDARAISFREDAGVIVVRAEAGASLPTLARLCVARGAGGLEWGATVPGTVGGAVFGNAGAHGTDVSSNLLVAEILHREAGIERWSAADLALDYRASRLKAEPESAVVLAAEFKLQAAKPAALQARVDAFIAQRRSTQPPGASMGSMFKNPPADYAGRLIEAAGLKNARIGNAQISALHANFFVNLGDAQAQDVYALIVLARSSVQQKLGVLLELEIGLLGEFADVLSVSLADAHG